MPHQTLKKFLTKLPDTKKYYIAYSGGLDSYVLLHAFSFLKENKFEAIHINHNLSPNAKAWSSHCQNVCEKLNIPYRAISVNATAEKGQSPEGAARLARYTAFDKIVNENEVLLTAQHQDDQAETLLVRLVMN